MNRKKEDYYTLLGVASSATEAEIKSAYRKAAMKHHPDRNPGDQQAEEMFKAVSEAYEVLSDSQKRGIYDRFGHDGLSGQGYQGPRDASDIFSAFGNIFEDFFGFGGGSGSRTSARRGSDLRYDLRLEFKEAVFGIEKEIEFDRQVDCLPCNGSGAKAGSKPVTCKTCHGHGQVRRNQGFFTVAMTCSSCEGAGSIIKDVCPQCRGSSKDKEHKKISVKIPPGVDAGLRLRVSGEGEVGQNGGPSGDLYVILDVEESRIFQRDGSTIYLEQDLSFVQAALGAQIEVETLEGHHTITVPTGSQHGDEVRLPQMGVPKLKGAGRGDFIVRFAIKIPTKLSKEQRDLLEKYAGTVQEKTGKGQSGFFQRIFEG